MAKKRKKKSNRGNGPLSQLSSGTKRVLLFIGLITLCAIIFLSAFGLAGSVGAYIDQIMSLAFGWTRLVACLALLLISIGVLFPDTDRITVWTYVGIGIFFLSGTALINLFALRSQPISDALLAANGGYLGLALQQLGTMTVGFFGTFVILLGLLTVSLVLLLHALFDDLAYLFSLWPSGSEEWAEEDEDEDDEEEYEEESEEVEEDEEPEEAPAPRRSLKALVTGGRKEQQEEEVLTTKRRGHRPDLSMDLLDNRGITPDSGDIERNGDLIERTFENFGIEVEVVDVSVGPTITQYAIRPAEGIKLSRIVALQNDLALSLAAHPIRIEAPIPGKSLIGIEVPNKTIATVGLRTILESKAFKKSGAPLTVALGMDVSGASWVADLGKMPHLLVAGATGSGKSVCLNNLIVSLLYQHGPDTLKFIMVDPKRVELPAYGGAPHLLVPPIIKAEEAINALKWTVREMERRLDVLSASSVRNITSYNKKSPEQMPYIVVVIDELADLMSTSSRDVEALIVRIAQMARAVGIHLILATQRPSVDVITGTIKANIPARIAFAVASQTDSRTILDYAGAEKLLGRGDMLYASNDLPKARRMQGAYLSDDEIKRVVEAVKQEEAPDYNYEILEYERGGGSVMGGEDSDPMMKQAIEVVIQAGKASTSFLQRRLRIGYSRAARIVDLLEEQGIVGTAQGSKPREVLIQSMDELTDGAGTEETEDLYTEDSQVEDESHGEETDDIEAPEEDWEGDDSNNEEEDYDD